MQHSIKSRPWFIMWFIMLGALTATTPLLTRPLLAQDTAEPAPLTPATGNPTAVAPVPAIDAPPVSLEPEVSVDELVRRALENNQQLPVARQTQEAARQRVAAARAFPSPTLEVVPRLLGDREAADEEMILSQPLDLFGRRRARAAVAGAELRAAEAQTTLTERSLVVTVKNAAADLFAAQEAESLGFVQVEVARLFRDAAARRAQLGDVPPVQVQRADLELLRVQNELTNAQAERLARRAVLNQIVGQAPETPLRVALPLSRDLADLLRVRPASARPGSTSGSSAIPPAVTTPGAVAGGQSSTDPAGSAVGASAQVGSNLVGSSLVGSNVVGSNLESLRGQILPEALSNRPDILSARATLEARRAQVQVLRRERLPDIELQARRSALTGSGSTAVRAVVTIPIFDFGSNKRERRALEAEAGAQEAQIALLRSQVAAQVEQALVRLQQQQLQVERYRTGIVPLTLELLRKTQIGYAQGASTYLEVLEAQRTLRQVQTEYLQAIVGTRTSEAQLESALGATPSAAVLGNIANPGGPATPPGVAAPGTVPEGTIAPNTVEPPNIPTAPSASVAPSAPILPSAPIAPSTPVAPGQGGD